jgi:hypothetical protein
MKERETAVEWLFLMLNGNLLEEETAQKLLIKAKALEKEQIIDAYSMGVSDEGRKTIHTRANAEEYYNETYGN